MIRKKLTPSLVVAVFVLSFALVALAGSTTNVLNYQIDHLGFVDNGNNTSTWTYAVTADGDEAKQALSHWTLGVGACYDILSPSDDSDYTTPTAGFGCGTTYNCEQTTCTVVHGVDATTGVSGIKFEDCDPQLSAVPPLPRTHIFRFTVAGVPSAPANVAVGLKTGAGQATGLVTGPSCGPNAVSIERLTAAQEANTGSLAAWAGGMFLAAAGLFVWRRNR